MICASPFKVSKQKTKYKLSVSGSWNLLLSESLSMKNSEGWLFVLADNIRM